MADFILSLIGCLAAVLLFVVGLVVGLVAGEKRGRKWLRENGCYLCREKARYAEPGTDDSSIDD